MKLVSRNSFYRWYKFNEHFSDKIDHARRHINRKAKEVVIKSIKNGDIKAAQWWLERKDRDSFDLKTSIMTDPADNYEDIDEEELHRVFEELIDNEIAERKRLEKL